MSTVQTETFERLKTAEKQRSGNVETATIAGVDVTDETVAVALQFEWSTDTEVLTYSLDDERDICRLADIAQSLGYQFDQLPALEGERLPVRYTERGWLPEPDADADDPVVDASTAESDSGGFGVPNPFAPAANRVREASTNQVIISVILVKKLLIVALIAYMIV